MSWHRAFADATQSGCRIWTFGCSCRRCCCWCCHTVDRLGGAKLLVAELCISFMPDAARLLFNMLLCGWRKLMWYLGNRISYSKVFQTTDCCYLLCMLVQSWACTWCCAGTEILSGVNCLYSDKCPVCCRIQQLVQDQYLMLLTSSS